MVVVAAVADVTVATTSATTKARKTMRSKLLPQTRAVVVLYRVVAAEAVADVDAAAVKQLLHELSKPSVIIFTKKPNQKTFLFSPPPFFLQSDATW